MIKKYILLKDSPELKKGAILEAVCREGGQGYDCDNKEFIRAKDQTVCHYTDDAIAKNPKWFERIEVVEVPKKHIAKVRKFVKSLK